MHLEWISTDIMISPEQIANREAPVSTSFFSNSIERLIASKIDCTTKSLLVINRTFEIQAKKNQLSSTASH